MKIKLTAILILLLTINISLPAQNVPDSLKKYKQICNVLVWGNNSNEYFKYSRRLDYWQHKNDSIAAIQYRYREAKLKKYLEKKYNIKL